MGHAKRPIDFLGWVHYADYHKRIRKRTKKRLKGVESATKNARPLDRFIYDRLNMRATFVQKTTGMTMKDFSFGASMNAGREKDI